MLARSISYAKDLLAEGYEYSGFEIASVVYDSVYGEDSGASMEKKFVDKFHRGFIDRPTVKEALPTRTVPDYSTDSILYALIPSLDETMLSLIISKKDFLYENHIDKWKSLSYSDRADLLERCPSGRWWQS